MIEINLLPEELRKKKKVQRFKPADLSSVDLSNFNLKSIRTLVKEIPALRWALISVGALIAFHMLLFTTGIYAKIRVHSLAKKYDVMLPQKKEADDLRAQSESITRKVTAINGLMVKRFSWARKLSDLSDSMAPGVWLSELSLESKMTERAAQSNDKSSGSKNRKGAATEKILVTYLVMSGYTSQMGESGAALVGKFIKSLKDNPNFYSDFSDITLVSIKSDKFDTQEVMNFKITCPFSEHKD